MLFRSDPVHGLTTPDMAEANVKRAMMRSARRSVVLADHTKFDSQHFASFASLSEVDVLITDYATPTHVLEQFVSPRLSVVVA